MGLDNYEGLEDSEHISSGREETREQYQERAKRAQNQLKKIQKDERYAKGDNQKLFLILSRFIQESYYESLIADVSSLLSMGFPSRGIIAFIALFYPDATFYIADVVGKKEKIHILLSLPRLSEMTDFDEKSLPSEIRIWISEWIILMDMFLLHESASILMNKRLLEMLYSEHKTFIEKILADFLIFFFAGRNVHLSIEKAKEYSNFIIKNISDKISKYLLLQEKNVQDLISHIEISQNDLFGEI